MSVKQVFLGGAKLTRLCSNGSMAEPLTALFTGTCKRHTLPAPLQQLDRAGIGGTASSGSAGALSATIFWRR